jgi:hypothetical protein
MANPLDAIVSYLSPLRAICRWQAQRQKREPPQRDAEPLARVPNQAGERSNNRYAGSFIAIHSNMGF